MKIKFTILFSGLFFLLNAQNIIDNKVSFQYIQLPKIKIDEISSIICIVPQIIASNLTYKYPNSVKEAQFSLQFAIAIILKFGSIKLEHLDKKFIQDNSIKKLMKLVKMKVDILPKNISKNEAICPILSP